MLGDHMLKASLGSSSNKEYIPTDDELLQSFLYNKVHKKPLPTSINVLEYDLYGSQKNPWEIWEEFSDSHSYGGKDLYFFTTLKKKSPTSSRLVRTIGMGHWEGEDTGKIIFSKDKNQPLGLKKRFRFEKSDTYHDGGWIMHEYSLHASLINSSMGKDIVLCRFRKNILRGKDLRSTSQTKQKRAVMVIERVDATKICNGVLLREEDIYQEPMNQPRGEDHKVIEISESEYKKEEDVGNTRQRMTIRVAAPTKSDNNNETAKQLNDEEKKTKLIETPAEEECEEGIEEEEEEEEDDDDVNNMSFLECFANKLRMINGENLLEEEDIQLDPNEFNKELLLERIDSKYFSNMKNG